MTYKIFVTETIVLPDRSLLERGAVLQSGIVNITDTMVALIGYRRQYDSRHITFAREDGGTT